MYKSVIFLIAIIALSSFRPYSAEDDATEVMQTAQRGMLEYLNKIPKGREVAYGFSAHDNMAQCAVAKPFRMLSLTKDFYQGGNISVTAIELKNEWRVPVMLNGTYNTLLTVAGDDHAYKVVDMGGAGLARELQQRMPAKGEYYILRVYPLASDFLVISTTGAISDATVIPLTSAVRAMPVLSTKSAYSVNEVLAIVKSALVKSTKN